MYKIIPNTDALKKFQEETGNTLPLWKNTQAVERVKEMAEQTDFYYGADRNITADLGGYIIILYGDSDEVEKEFDGVLQRYGMEKDLCESEDEYQNGQNIVVIRLYICSNDYAVVIVTVQ